MSPGAAEVDLARSRVVNERDVVAVRALARRAGELLGLDQQDCTRVATATSEAARVARRSSPATVGLDVVTEAGEPAGKPLLRVTLRREDGRPIVLGEPASTACHRLMDGVHPSGAAVVMTKVLPGQVPEDLDAVREELASAGIGDLLGVLQAQNEELAGALVALRDRESDLVRLNEELEQTNRGVVALYAELEQRAAAVRNAQRLVFEELEGALRPPPPSMRDVDLDVRYLPAQVNSPTGGDLYDWLVLPDGRLHVTVVDVQGHGVASTRDALAVTHAVRTLALEGHPLRQVVERTDALLQTPDHEVVATVLLAQFDPATGELHLAGGGHPPALLVPARGPVRYVEAPGRPVGYPLAGSDDMTVVELAPGDTVLLYTDGLIELHRDIVLGLDVLQVAGEAARAGNGRIGVALDAIVAAVAEGEPLGDDTLLLGLRWSPPPQGWTR